MYEYNSFWNKRDAFDRHMEKIAEDNKKLMLKYKNKENEKINNKENEKINNIER